MTIIKILLWFKTSELNSEVGGGICLVPLFINDPPPPNFQNPKFTTPTLLNLKSTTPSKSQISRPLPNVLTPPPKKKIWVWNPLSPPFPLRPPPPSSYSMFRKKLVLEALQSLCNKVTGLKVWFQHRLKTCNFIKKRLQHRCFSVNIAKFLKAFFYGTPLVVTSEPRHLIQHKAWKG